MAKPTLNINTYQSGHFGVTVAECIWLDGTQYAAEKVVDLSGLTSYTTTLSIRKISVTISAGMSALVQFDLTANEDVIQVPLGALRNEAVFADEQQGPNGLPPQTGGSTGDLVVTTIGAAADDEMCIIVHWHAD